MHVRKNFYKIRNLVENIKNVKNFQIFLKICLNFKYDLFTVSHATKSLNNSVSKFLRHFGLKKKKK